MCWFMRNWFVFIYVGFFLIFDDLWIWGFGEFLSFWDFVFFFLLLVFKCWIVFWLVGCCFLFFLVFVFVFVLCKKFFFVICGLWIGFIILFVFKLLIFFFKIFLVVVWGICMMLCGKFMFLLLFVFDLIGLVGVGFFDLFFNFFFFGIGFGNMLIFFGGMKFKGSNKFLCKVCIFFDLFFCWIL